MSVIRNKHFKTTLFTLLGIGILYLVFRNVSFDSVWQAASKAHLPWILMAMAIGILGHWIRGARWVLMLRSMSYKPKYYPAFLSVIAGYFINLAIPRAGEISRCGLMSNVSGIPVQKLIGTVVTERIIDLIMTVIIVFLVLLIQFETLFHFTQTWLFNPLQERFSSLLNNPGRLILTSFIALTMFFLVVFFFKKARRKERGQNRIILFLMGIGEGVRSIFKLKSPVLFIVQTVAIWTTYLGSTYCIIRAFDFASDLHLGSALSVLLFSTIGVIVPAPGGVGSIWTTQNGLMEIYAFPESQATALASVLFFTQVVGFVILGIFALVQLGMLKNKRNETSGI